MNLKNDSQYKTIILNKFTKKSLTSTNAYLIYLALVDFIFHILIATNYGYFRDELYYIVSGTQHLSLGYVDFPPFIAYVAAVLGVITNDSLLSIHIVSAFVESLLVILTGLIARELGGGRRAQVLASFTTLISLGFLADGLLFSPDTFDQLWWALFAYIIIKLINDNNPKLWLYPGFTLGLGLLTKLTILFFVLALGFSFLLFPRSREYLKSKWLLVGGAISILFILPMIYWNAINQWPMLNFYLEFRGDVSGGGPISFTFTQIATLNFLNIIICILGLFFYLKKNDKYEYRPFGLAFILLFVFMLVLNMKPYYFFPIYTIMFAAGAMILEKGLTTNIGRVRWAGTRPYLAVTVLITVFLVPEVLPILSPGTMISIYGVSTMNTSSAETGPLPQVLGDRLGWNEMVTQTLQVFKGLPIADQSQSCIFTANYGEASAINFLGKNTGLPLAISGHNNYYIWGPGSCSGKVLLTLGVTLPPNQTIYQNVTLMTTINCQYCMNLESNVPVFLLTNPYNNSFDINAFWSSLRHYD